MIKHVILFSFKCLVSSAGGTGRDSENRRQAVADMSRTLKTMAKELNVPMICLSQLSRTIKQRADKRPTLSDLRESGAIAQEADPVSIPGWLLYEVRQRVPIGLPLS